MPTVLRSGAYRLFFYSADRDEPPLVHVELEESEAKFWLDPDTPGEKPWLALRELRRMEALIVENGTFLLGEGMA